YPQPPSSASNQANSAAVHYSYDEYDRNAAAYAPAYSSEQPFTNTPYSVAPQLEQSEPSYLNSEYSSNVIPPEPTPFISSGYQPAEVVSFLFLKPVKLFSNKDLKTPPRPVPPASHHGGPPGRPKVPPSPKPPIKKVEPEVDAWTQFKQLTEKAGEAVKATEDKLKVLSETTVANEVKDESYIAKIGGTQTFVPEMAQKQIRAQQEEMAMKKADKKKHKKGHKNVTEVFSPMDEEKMDKAAEELVKKMAATRMDLEVWMLPNISFRSLNRWTAFDDQSTTHLPPSESDFFSTATSSNTDEAFGSTKIDDAFTAGSSKDPFAPLEKDLIDQNYDPFEVKPPEAVFEAAKSKAAAESAAAEAQQDLDFFGGINEVLESGVSTPTEGASPASSRPAGFDDDFHPDSPLYDEDDTEPLADFPPKFTGDGWNLMIRFPIKKKLMGERFWKPCFVKLQGCTLFLFDSKKEQKPFQELLLQASYSLSDTTLQAYDIYGKIHTVKLQYVVYKERVGIRPGQISRLVEGHITKYGLPLEHSAQCTVLLKFGCLNASELASFVSSVEDVLFRCPTRREVSPVYKQDEVQIHCYDEYSSYVDKDGVVSDQKARVRIFCLAFLTGSPLIEIGLNDRRRQGKEIVRRKDILPMYTERWIRFENIEFHNTVNRELFDKEQIISFQPPDGVFFEVMRFRIRPPKNREKPLTVKSMMKIAGSKIEIRIEAMAAAQIQKTKGGRVTKNQIPCEDIQIRFPIPEAWIYLFREERNWGVGSVHSKIRRPGKVKNLKDRLRGVVQNLDNSLIEVAIGEAKYEHVYRALVWRIPRLPERHHEAYKQHLLTCRFELSSFDLMPETFMQTCDVEFTMPLAVISNAVVRSVSVEQHEDSDRVEKFVRYVAKCNYKVEVDYVQCSTLDVDAIVDPTNVNPEASHEVIPELHKPAFNPDENKDNYAGYRIDLPDEHIDVRQKTEDSSSEDGESENKTPMIQIDMKGYGY
uniref:MHD domain-containing protein n=1 Tax=Syphacia muris TaxID=451379 RepID=A0A0N5AIT8_9BILA